MQKLLENLSKEDMLSVLPVLAAINQVNNGLGSNSGIFNPVSGFGGSGDQSSYNILTANYDLHCSSVDSIELYYTFGSPLIQHAVNIYPDFTRLSSFHFEDKTLNAKIDRKDEIINTVAIMDRYRRLDGSCVAVNMNRFGGSGIKVLNPLCLEYLGDDKYRVTPYTDDDSEFLLAQVILNKEDYFKFDNIWMPNRLQEHNNNFAISTVQIILDALIDFLETKSSAKSVLQKHNILTYGIEGLSKFLLAGNNERIQDVIKNLLLTISVKNHLYHDAKNKPGFISQNLTGLSDIFLQFQDQIPAIAKCPGSIFWSSTQKGGGLGNTSKSDLETWESYLNAYRGQHYKEPIKWLIGEFYGIVDKERDKLPIILDPIVLIENKKLEIEDYKAKTDRIFKAKQCGAIDNEQAQKLFFPEIFGALSVG